MDRFAIRRATAFAPLGIVLTLTGLTACGSTAPPASGGSVDASTYTAVIGRFVPAPIDAETPQVMYVAGVGVDEMSLEDQVVVIDSFAATHEVRFVDDFAAAVDDQAPGAPPKDAGVLIGVGRISSDPPHQVRVEVYVDADRVDAQLVTVAYRTGDWVVESVEPVEPEVLVGDE